jgi:hypothetical protein
LACKSARERDLENARTRENPDIAIKSAVSATYAQHEAERSEEKRDKVKARHSLQHEVMCLECESLIVTQVVSDGECKVVCKSCKQKYVLSHKGNLTYIGPRGVAMTGAEDFNIKEDRLCSTCKHYGENLTKRELSECSRSRHDCSHPGAVSAAREGYLGADTNPNNRCRFWEVLTPEEQRKREILDMIPWVITVIVIAGLIVWLKVGVPFLDVFLATVIFIVIARLIARFKLR